MKEIRKIFIIIMLIFISLFTISCGKEETEDNSNNDIKRISDLEEEDFDVNKYELKEIPFVFVEKLGRLTNYEKHTIGETKAKVIINYNQKIDSLFTCKDGEKHLVTDSSSVLVKAYHEVYFDDTDAKVKNKKKDDFSTISIDDYIDTYGYLPYGYNLEGFTLSDESVLSVDRISEEEYKYEVVLDGNYGNSGVYTQMKKFGGFSDDPIFSSIIITITMEVDFTPIAIEMNSEFKINYPVIGVMNCKQNYIVTYTIYDDNK